MKNSSFRYDYILWTDSSVKEVNGEWVCGYGVAILNCETLEFATFGDAIGNRTIAYGELWAIYKGIEKALKFCGHKSKKKILVVTDNKLAVNGYILYIPQGIWDTSNPKCWKTLRKTPVKNQGVYKKTLEVIRKYPNVRVRIAHMHGHVTKKKEDIIARDLEKHGIHADAETVQIFREMNARVDKIAGDAVDRQIRLDKQYGPIDLLCRKDLLDYDGEVD